MSETGGKVAQRLRKLAAKTDDTNFPAPTLWKVVLHLHKCCDALIPTPEYLNENIKTFYFTLLRLLSLI